MAKERAIDRAERQAARRAMSGEEAVEGVPRPGEIERAADQRRERHLIDEESPVAGDRLRERVPRALDPADLGQKLDLQQGDRRDPPGSAVVNPGEIGKPLGSKCDPEQEVGVQQQLTCHRFAAREPAPGPATPSAIDRLHPGPPPARCQSSLSPPWAPVAPRGGAARPAIPRARSPPPRRRRSHRGVGTNSYGPPSRSVISYVHCTSGPLAGQWAQQAAKVSTASQRDELNTSSPGDGRGPSGRELSEVDIGWMILAHDRVAMDGHAIEIGVDEDAATVSARAAIADDDAAAELATDRRLEVEA